ncbi:MAG: hypothetical protein ACRDOG_08725, partial [Gaiellaceae bacterium]
MTKLDQALARLGSEIEFPETPDVAAAVRRRLGVRRRGRPLGRTLALAFVVLAVLAGAILAVPPARSAILEWLGLRGATVEKVETLPDLPSRVPASLELGRPVPIEDGRPRVELPFLLVPAALGAPDAAYYSSAVPGGKLSLVYEPRDDLPRSRFTGVGLLVTQFSGRASPDFVSKLVDQGVSVERIEVEGRPGLWIEGGPHALLFRGPEGRIL